MCDTLRALSWMLCRAELPAVTSRQAHPDWDAQNVAFSLQSWQCRMDELGPQADVKALNQLLGTNPGSPSCKRINFLYVGLVLSLAVSWQRLLVCLMNMEVGGEETAREALQIASEQWH